MNSLYADRVATYGRGWHRPWLALTICFAIALLLQWRPQDLPAAVCEQQPDSRFRAAVEEDGLIWTADLDAALACAHKLGRRVLVSVEAITDCNCLINKRNVFTRPDVRKAFKPYVLVVLHIDWIPDPYYLDKQSEEQQRQDGRANSEFLLHTFNTMQEPLYVVLEPKNDGAFNVVEIYEEAMIHKSDEFIAFLRDPKQRQARQDFRMPWEIVTGLFRAGR